MSLTYLVPALVRMYRRRQRARGRMALFGLGYFSNWRQRVRQPGGRRYWAMAFVGP